MSTRRPTPLWLHARWTSRKLESARRVARAIAVLEQEGARVSLRAIAKRAEALDQAPLSVSTIQSNEAAYALYLKARGPGSRPEYRCGRLRAIMEATAVEKRTGLRTRVQRLRRMRKDELIASLLELQGRLSELEAQATRLREEVLRLAENHLDQRSADR